MAGLQLRNRHKPSQESEIPVVTFLDRALVIRGHFQAAGEVHVQGRVYGRIDADRVVIAPWGFVEGDIVAREVCVVGRFMGRIFALNVVVEEQAELEGRVFHNTIAVARGARIDARMPWRPPNYFDALDQLPETRP